MEAVLEACFLIAAAYPWLRLAVNGGFWRKLRVFPATAAVFVAVLTAYFGLIACLALWFPAALRLVCIAVICAVIFARWRARSGYGRSRGLPPGSLALVPIAPWIDDLYYHKQAARYGPVFKSSPFIQPVVCVVGLKSARELLRSHDALLEIAPLPFTRFIPGGFLRYMQPADHYRYSSIIRSSLATAVVEECEPFIARAIRNELFRMSDDAASEWRTGIQPEPYLDRMLFTILTRVFFGVLPETVAFARMEALYGVIDYRHAWRTLPFRVIRALEDTTAILDEQMTQWSQLNRHDARAARCILQEMIHVHPETAQDRTALWNLIYLLQTSWRDLAGLLQWRLKMLSDHPVWVDRLREETASEHHQPGALATRIVLETLRLEQSDYLMRRATQEIRFNGFVIPRGWQLRICVRESHRSGDAFVEPERFNPDRFRVGDQPRHAYSPFGASRIHCPGEHLSLSVGQIFVSELALGFDWEVTQDGRLEYGGFHWKPSSKFRVHMTPRDSVVRGPTVTPKQ